MHRFSHTYGKLLFLCAALLLVGLILLFFGADSKVNQANLDLIHSYGWEVDDTPEEIVRLTIPKTFDSVFAAYNATVSSSGFDLTPYQGINASRYTYRVLNHKDSKSGLIRIHVFVSKSGIVAADICSLAPDGFLLPINDATGQMPKN